jgi:hypothetical protein
VNIQATIEATRDGALDISGIRFEKKIDASPILKLIDTSLWCEPNKIDNIGMHIARPRAATCCVLMLCVLFTCLSYCHSRFESADDSDRRLSYV